MHGAAASACCTDAVLSGASGTCVCEGWWALEEPQGRPDLDGIIDALQKWMFDGPVITSEWISSGRFAWVGQQGCQATRRAPQTVASISAAASSVDGEKYLRETVQCFLMLLIWYTDHFRISVIQ